MSFRKTIYLLSGWCLLLAGGAGIATPAKAQNPAMPGSFEALAASPTQINCYWLPAEGATGYRLLRNGQVIATLPPTATTYSDTNLEPNTNYTYVIEAEHGDEKPVAAPAYLERTFPVFPAGKTLDFDVVVMQASSGGVAAAIEAAKRGWKVALVEPTTRPGGMPVNGLCATDLRRPYHACNFFVRFQDEVKRIYAAEGIETNGLSYEPHVALQAMKWLLFSTPNITLYRLATLGKVFSEPSDAEGHRRVTAVQIEELKPDGTPTGRFALLRAKVFIDATDCGDLAAAAGAPFRLGREPRTPQEPHAGVIYYDRTTDTLLPGSTGKGDKRIQSYAYLLVVKDYGPGTDHTIPKPPGYNEQDYIHTPPWKQSWAFTSGRMPGHKFELNQHPQGNDWQGINYRYPLDDWKQRARIAELYRNHVLGYLYYIQTVQGQKQLGLPDDEFRDSGGFPPLLYVREGRRIVGQQLPTEADITYARHIIRPESIGIGDYPMDSHAVEPKRNWNRPDLGEGEFWLYRYTPWHELPLGIIVPKRLDNVWVVIAVSSTHVSYGTYRLELVRMAFGEAAGIGAALSLEFHLKSRQVPARQIQLEMLPDFTAPYADPHAVLYYFPDVPPSCKNYMQIQYLAARGFANSMTYFHPDAPTTWSELTRWLTRLAERAAPPPKVIGETTDSQGHPLQIVKKAFAPYMGQPVNLQALKELQEKPQSDLPITRAEMAHWLIKVMGWKEAPASLADRYVDLTTEQEKRDAATLYQHDINSMMWDGYDAIRPDNKLAFQPDAPISHADMFAVLYVAQIGLGPLFYDNPIDGRNGRRVPPIPYEIVTVPKPSEKSEPNLRTYD